MKPILLLGLVLQSLYAVQCTEAYNDMRIAQVRLQHVSGRESFYNISCYQLLPSMIELQRCKGWNTTDIHSSIESTKNICSSH